jgi:hypothetical protein
MKLLLYHRLHRRQYYPMAVIMMLLLYHHGYPSSLRNRNERCKIARRKTPQPNRCCQQKMVPRERERENAVNAERLQATKSDLEKSTTRTLCRLMHHPKNLQLDDCNEDVVMNCVKFMVLLISCSIGASDGIKLFSL